MYLDMKHKPMGGQNTLAWPGQYKCIVKYKEVIMNVLKLFLLLGINLKANYKPEQSLSLLLDIHPTVNTEFRVFST